MGLKHLALGLAVVTAAPDRNHNSSSSERDIHPAVHLQDRSLCRVRHTDRQRHGRLFHHAQRA